MGFSTDNASFGFAGRGRRTTHLFVLALLILGTVLALTRPTGSVTAQVDDTMLGVLGTYGSALFVELDEITGVRSADTLVFGTCVEGEETKDTLSGRYSNDAFGEYELHVYPETTPYIVVEYGEGNTLVFNQATARLTERVLADLTAAVSSER